MSNSMESRYKVIRDIEVKVYIYREALNFNLLRHINGIRYIDVRDVRDGDA